MGPAMQYRATAELMSDVIISHGVVIDRRATLRSALVTPNTYIGELVEVSNAMVDGVRGFILTVMPSRERLMGSCWRGFARPRLAPGGS